MEIAGIRKPEIGIEVSENALREHGMSFDDVARALKKSSVDIPGGVARTSSGETLLGRWVKHGTAENLMNWR